MSAVVEAPRRSADGELVGLRVNIESKIIIVSLRQNDHGYFLRISNAAGSSGHGKLNISATGISDLQKAISNISQYDQTLRDDFEELQESRQSGSMRIPLRSERFSCGPRRLFLDLLRNDRGRYCKLSSIETDGKRISIIFPASGLIAMKEALDDVQWRLPRSASGRDKSRPKSVSDYREGREMFVEGKRYLFETVTSRHGSSVHIADDSSATAIAVPVSGLPHMIEILKSFVDDEFHFGNGSIENMVTQYEDDNSEDLDGGDDAAAVIEV